MRYVLAVAAALALSGCGTAYDPAACLRSPNITMSYDPRPEPKAIVAGWDGQRTVCYEGHNAALNEQLALCQKGGVQQCKMVAQNKTLLVPVGTAAPAQSNDALYDVLGAAASGAVAGYNQVQDDKLATQRAVAAQAAAAPRKFTCTPVYGSNQMTCK